ncbi:unnamed protein product, partial [Rotaria sp. Silwood2]
FDGGCHINSIVERDNDSPRKLSSDSGCHCNIRKYAIGENNPTVLTCDVIDA